MLTVLWVLWVLCVLCVLWVLCVLCMLCVLCVLWVLCVLCAIGMLGVPGVMCWCALFPTSAPPLPLAARVSPRAATKRMHVARCPPPVATLHGRLGFAAAGALPPLESLSDRWRQSVLIAVSVSNDLLREFWSLVNSAFRPPHSARTLGAFVDRVVPPCAPRCVALSLDVAHPPA